jgi:hypothetical protein
MIINAGIGKVICPDEYGEPVIVYDNPGWYNINGNLLTDFMDKGDYGY